MSVRRNAPSIGIELQHNTENASKPSSSSSTSRQKMTSSSSPFLPTPLELRLLLLYPLTLVLGSLFSTLAPSIRASKSTYSATHQSFQPAHAAPSYFAQKRNIFNVYFVKLGWAWTTAALLLFALTHPSLGPSLRPFPTRKRLQLLARYAAATLLWTLTTQWCLGAPLIDRSFRLTGGSCALLQAERAGAVPPLDPIKEIVTSAQCKLQGGTWSGGVDISGHVFLLILGSTLLWMEVLPAVLRARGLREARTVLLHDGTVAAAHAATKSASADTGRAKRSDDAGDVGVQVTGLGVKFIVGVVALMWWMLLMTAAFFHTWTEKLSGLVVAFLGIWIVYFLPRGVPLIRSVLGMPGI